MTNDQIKKTRELIDQIDDPINYSDVIMKLFRLALDGHEDANLQIEELKKQLHEATHHGQHMTCGACEQIRETGSEKRVCGCVQSDLAPSGIDYCEKHKPITENRVAECTCYAKVKGFPVHTPSCPAASEEDKK